MKRWIISKPKSYIPNTFESVLIELPCPYAEFSYQAPYSYSFHQTCPIKKSVAVSCNLGISLTF